MFLCLSLLARSFSMVVKKSRCWRQSSRIGEKRLWRRNKKREKRGLSFFFPLYSFCFLFVFRLSCVPIPTENAHQIFGYRLVVRFLLLSPSPPFLFCLFLFPNSSTRSIYCKSAGFRRLIRQVQDHKIRVSLFMSRQRHTRRIVVAVSYLGCCSLFLSFFCGERRNSSSRHTVYWFFVSMSLYSYCFVLWRWENRRRRRLVTVVTTRAKKGIHTHTQKKWFRN
jgi:hypothetical protein